MPRHWLRSLFRAAPVAPLRRPPARPRLQQLEGREVPATLYVDPSFTPANYPAGVPDGDLGTAAGELATVGTTAFATIGAAVARAAVLAGPDTIIVNTAVYPEAVTLSDTDTLEVTLDDPTTPGAVSIIGLTGPVGSAVALCGTSVLTIDVGGTTFAGAIGGADGGRLAKTGAATFSLSGTNTYTGGTAVDDGTLVIDGSVAGDVAVAAGATLGGTGSVAGDVVVTGTVAPDGTLDVGGDLAVSGTLAVDALTDQLAVGGTVTLGAGSTLAVALGGAAATNQIIRAIDNAGADAVVGAFGTLADGADTFRVFTTGGTGNDVVLVEAAVAPATVYVDDDFPSDGQEVTDPDPTVVGEPPAVVGVTAFRSLTPAVGAVAAGGTVVARAGSYTTALLPSGVNLRVTAAAAVSVASLTGLAASSLNLQPGSVLTVAGSSNTTFAGPVTGSGTLTRAGTGTLTLTGTSNAFAGGVVVGGGRLNVNGTIDADVTVNGGTLGGSGTVTGDVTVNAGGTLGSAAGTDALAVTGSVTVNAGGRVAPGESPGIIVIGGNFVVAGTLDLEVNPPAATPGVDYDQIQVGGTVDLAAATINLTGTAQPPAVAVNQVVTLISKTSAGPIILPAAGPAQGDDVAIPDPVVAGSTAYRAFYTGGTGNDFVLVALGLAPAAAPAAVYVNDDWAGLADGQPVPGDADPSAPGVQVGVVGVNAFDTVPEGVAAVAADGTVIVLGGAGNYGPVTLNKSVTLVAVTDPTPNPDQTTVTLGAVTLNGADFTAVLALVDDVVPPDPPIPVTLAVASITGNNGAAGVGPEAVAVTTRVANTGTFTTGAVTNVAGVRVGATAAPLAAASFAGVTTGGGGLVVDAAAITLTGNVNTAAAAAGDAGPVALTGAVRLPVPAATIAINTDTANPAPAADGDITVDGTVDAVGLDTNLTLTAGSAAVDLRGAVGGLVALGVLTSTSDAFDATAVNVTTRLSVTNTDATGGSEITGVIGLVGATTAEVVKDGSGVLVLSGANTYTGVTTVNPGPVPPGGAATGTLRVVGAGRLGADTARTVVLDGATLDVRTDVDNEPIDLDGRLINGDPPGAPDEPGTVGGPVTLTGDADVGGAGTLTINGVIDDAAADFRVFKIGTGTTTLSAANTYSGGTTVARGTLQLTNVAGSGTGSGPVEVTPPVGQTAALGGTGRAGVVNARGTVAPGLAAPDDTTGTLSAGDAITPVAVTLGDDSTFAVELTSAAAGEFDQLAVTGTVTLAGAPLTGPTLALSGTFVPNPAGLTRFVIVSNDGADPINGRFAGLPEGASIPFGGLDANGNPRLLFISYVGGDGADNNDIVLSTQPVFAGDTFVLRRRSATQDEVSVDGQPFVPVPAGIDLTFEGDGDADGIPDLLIVDTSNGNPLAAGAVSYTGAVLRVDRADGAAPAAADAVVLEPTAATAGAEAGVVTVGGGAALTYAGTTRIDFVNLTAADVRTGAGAGTGADTLDLDDGPTAAAPPAGLLPNFDTDYAARLAAADALVVTGSAGSVIPTVGLREVRTATVNTEAAGPVAADTVTVRGGDEGHEVRNLTLLTGTAAGGAVDDQVTFAGSSVFDEALTVVTGVLPADVLLPGDGGNVDFTGGRTQAGSITLTVGGTVDELAAATVATAGTLTTRSAGGVSLPADGNAVARFDAVNRLEAGNPLPGTVLLDNTAAELGIARVNQLDGGNVDLTNRGRLTVLGTGAGVSTRDLDPATPTPSTIGLTTLADPDPLAPARPIAVDAAVRTTGRGAIGATAAGRIDQAAGTAAAPAGLFDTDGRLTTVSVGGQDLGGLNTVGRLDATNTGGQDLRLINAIANLGLDRVDQAAGGNIVVTNSGGLTVAAAGAGAAPGVLPGAGLGVTAAGGDVALTADGFDRAGAALPAGAAPLTADARVETTGGAAILLRTTGTTNPIGVNAVVGTGVGATGAIRADAAGRIDQTPGGAPGAGGYFDTDGRLTTVSVGGQTLAGFNAVARLDAVNAAGDAVVLTNTQPLDIDRLRQSDRGDIAVTNAGGLTVAAAGGGVAGDGAGAGVTTTEDAIDLRATAGAVTANAVVSTTDAGSIGLTADAAGVGVNAAVTTGSGPISATAGAGAITQGGGRFGTTGLLDTSSTAGQSLGGGNTVGALDATNAGTGAIVLNNAAADLQVRRVSQAGGGAVGVENAGGLTVTAGTGGVGADGGTVGLKAAGGRIAVADGVRTTGDGLVALDATGAGSGIAVNAAVTTDAGAILATAGGAITQAGGSFGTAGTLFATSAAGSTLTGANAVGGFRASNTGTGEVNLTNTRPLAVAGISQQAAGGAVTVTNAAALDVTGAVSAAGGVVGLTATAGGLTVGGAVGTTGGGGIGLAATAGGLAVNAPVTTDAGLVAVSAAAGIALAGSVSTGGPVALTAAAGGVTQTGGGVTTSALVLQGAGAFALASGANDVVGTLRADVAGAVTVRDANALTVDPTAGISTRGGNLTLTTGGSFTARDGRAGGTAGNLAAPLIDVGAGTVTIVPLGGDGGPPTQVLVAAGVRASRLTVGADGAANLNPNDVQIDPTPTLAVAEVIGNNPTPAQVTAARPGDSILVRPRPGVEVRLSQVSRDETGFSGVYTATYATGGTTTVPFRQIESFLNLGYRAAVVQTAARDYSIRLQLVQLRPQSGSVRGAAIEANPFVVSPDRVNRAAPYGAPTLSFADVNGDRTQDLIVANGPDDEPLVTVIDGNKLFNPGTTDATLLDLSQLRPDQLIAQFYAFVDPARDPASALTFLGGLSVAAADFNGDGKAELAVGAGVGGGPRVQMYHFTPTGSPYTAMQPGAPAGAPGNLGNLFAFEETQRGGVTVAAGDVTGDGVPDLVVGAGVGGGPRVKVYDGKTGAVVRDFLAYDASLRDGVRVAVGNFNNAGGADILTGPGFGGAPHVKVFDGDVAALGPDVGLLANFFALGFDPAAPAAGLGALPAAFNGVGGVAFGAPRESGQQEILVSSGPGRPLVARGYRLTAGQVSAAAVNTPSGDPAQDGFYDLFDVLTNPLTAGIPIGDPANPVKAGGLFFGASVAGAAVRDTSGTAGTTT